MPSMTTDSSHTALRQQAIDAAAAAYLAALERINASALPTSERADATGTAHELSRVRAASRS